MVEFFPGQYILGFHKAYELQLLDRSYPEGGLNLISAQYFDASRCTSIVPMPGFDFEVFPFVVVQVNNGLFLINVKDKCVTDLGPVQLSTHVGNSIGILQNDEYISIYFISEKCHGSGSGGTYECYLNKINLRKITINV